MIWKPMPGEGFGEDPARARKLAALKARQARKQEPLNPLETSGETQRSRTDPDARSLRKGKQQVTGYNVPSCVDDQHQLIVPHDVTNAGNDPNPLSHQCRQTMVVLGVENRTVVADAGDDNARELAACEAAGATVYAPIPDQHQAVTGQGRLSGQRFQYRPTQDVDRCPAGEVLPPVRSAAGEERSPAHPLQPRPANQCRNCPLRPVCLPASGAPRRIDRSEHAELAAAHRPRMADQGAARRRQRAGLVEHPFGTLKRWLGWDHFLVRGFAKVRGEMSPMVLGYNLLRVINRLSVGAFRDDCTRRKPVKSVKAIAQLVG